MARQLYDAWGQVRVRGDLQTDIGYTAQREDVGINAMFYRARFYSPALGRFLSADTIVPEPGNPQSLNRYTYVRNRPLNYIDPSGHKECEKSTDVGTCQGATNRERAWADLSSEVLAYCAQSGGCDSGLGEFLKDAASLNDVVDAAITAEKCAKGQCDGWDVIGAAAPVLSGRLLRTGVEFVGDIFKKIFGKADDVAAVVVRNIDDVPTLGRPGRQPNVRVLTGDIKEAQGLFDELSKGALDVKPIKDGGLVANLGDGRYVAFRPTSSHVSNYVPTVYVNDPAIGYWEVKFEP